MIITKIYEQGQLKDTNPWWRFKGAVADFNTIQRVSNKCCFCIVLIVVLTYSLSFRIFRPE